MSGTTRSYTRPEVIVGDDDKIAHFYFIQHLTQHFHSSSLSHSIVSFYIISFFFGNLQNTKGGFHQ